MKLLSFKKNENFLSLMISSNNKGMIIIVVIMIAFILITLAVGFSMITRSSINIQSDDLKMKKLYWACESGSNYNMNWLETLTLTQLYEYNVNYPDSAITLNSWNSTEGITVELNRTKFANPDGSANWKLRSKATGFGRTCTITIRNFMFKPQNGPLQNSLAIFNTLASATAQYNKAYFMENHTFYGSCYFDTEMVIKSEGLDGPTFYNEVYSASDFPTVVKAGDDMSGTDYSHGLYDNTTKTIGTTAQQRFESVFKGGYLKLVDPYNPNDITKTWAEIGDETYDYILTNATVPYNDVKIKVVIDGAVTKAIIYSGSTPKDTLIIGSGSGEYQTIGVPKEYGDVYVEGQSAKDLTIITQSDDIYLDNDFYVPELNGYDNLSYNNITESKLKEMYDKIQTADAHLALVAGLEDGANFRISVNDNILTTAVLLTPRGELNTTNSNVRSTFINVGALVILNEISQAAQPSQKFHQYLVEDLRLTNDLDEIPVHFNDIIDTVNPEIDLNDESIWSIDWE